jgi:hypothetical protein
VSHPQLLQPHDEELHPLEDAAQPHDGAALQVLSQEFAAAPLSPAHAQPAELQSLTLALPALFVAGGVA